MTKIILGDVHLTSKTPIQYRLGRLHLTMSRLAKHARRTCSHTGEYLCHEIIGTKYRCAILFPGLRSPELVRVSNGRPLRIDPAIPKCPLVLNRCAAVLVAGDCS